MGKVATKNNCQQALECFNRDPNGASSVDVQRTHFCLLLQALLKAAVFGQVPCSFRPNFSCLAHNSEKAQDSEKEPVEEAEVQAECVDYFTRMVRTPNTPFFVPKSFHRMGTSFMVSLIVSIFCQIDRQRRCDSFAVDAPLLPFLQAVKAKPLLTFLAERGQIPALLRPAMAGGMGYPTVGQN